MTINTQKYYTTLITITFTFILTTLASSHGYLESLPKNEYLEIQKTLVKEGYLKIPKGTSIEEVEEMTDEAYDNYQVKQNSILRKQHELEMASKTAAENNIPVPETFWQKIISKIFSWF